MHLNGNMDCLEMSNSSLNVCDCCGCRNASYDFEWYCDVMSRCVNYDSLLFMNVIVDGKC